MKFMFLLAKKRLNKFMQDQPFSLLRIARAMDVPVEDLTAIVKNKSGVNDYAGKVVDLLAADKQEAFIKRLYAKPAKVRASMPGKAVADSVQGRALAALDYYLSLAGISQCDASRHLGYESEQAINKMRMKQKSGELGDRSASTLLTRAINATNVLLAQDASIQDEAIARLDAFCGRFSFSDLRASLSLGYSGNNVYQIRRSYQEGRLSSAAARKLLQRIAAYAQQEDDVSMMGKDSQAVFAARFQKVLGHSLDEVCSVLPEIELVLAAKHADENFKLHIDVAG